VKIIVNNSLRPFSHTPGTFCLIPGTKWGVSAYPSKLSFIDLESLDSGEVTLGIEGPVKNFTCVQDLDKGRVYVFGMEKRGYFRFEIFATSEGIELALNRCFKEGIAISVYEKLIRTLYRQDRITLDIKVSEIECFSKDIERLSLGSSKKQDWDLIVRRSDIREIFPIWLKLGILLPEKNPPENHPLVQEIEKKIKKRDRVNIEGDFLNLFFSNFKGIMCPMRLPQNHLGIINAKPFSFSPFILLQKGAKYIQRLFFEQEGLCIHILPCLPKALTCGRYINIQCDEVGVLDMEWSKKTIKKLKLHAKADNKIRFKLQKNIVSYRVRTSLKDKGKVYKADDELPLQSGKIYFFDRFKK